MAGKGMKTSKVSDSVLSKSIPVQRTDLSTFDDSFSFLKEKFAAEMKRMDEEMNKFSVDLMTLYGQSLPAPAGLTPESDSPATWETISDSPLVQGEGMDKILKLQFDVSQFDPSEVRVQIVKNLLVVSATHEEKTDNSSVFREFKREFLLPKGTNTENVISSLSRDGVLTVQTPFPLLTIEEKTKSPDKDSPKSPQSAMSTNPQTPQMPQSALNIQSPKKAGSKSSKK